MSKCSQSILNSTHYTQFNKTLGPAFKNRKLSNNIDDFYTAEDLDEIGYYKFSEYSFFEYKHLTRRINKEMTFAIEPHFSLLEYKSRLIFTHNILEKQLTLTVKKIEAP